MQHAMARGSCATTRPSNLCLTHCSATLVCLWQRLDGLMVEQSGEGATPGLASNTTHTGHIVYMYLFPTVRAHMHPQAVCTRLSSRLCADTAARTGRLHTACQCFQHSRNQRYQFLLCWQQTTTHPRQRTRDVLQADRSSAPQRA